ncbi:MAG: hypothetical protein IT221_13905 [Fluviicola sp.]|nr:hypothetical protein [Fluviicola sp.]
MDKELLDDQIKEKALGVNGVISQNLEIAAKWSRYIAVSGFIFFSLYSIRFGYDLFYNFFYLLTNISVLFETVINLVLIGCGFAALVYLNRFSTDMKMALAYKRDADLETGFKNLKLFLKYLGYFVVTISAVALFVLIYVFLLRMT